MTRFLAASFALALPGAAWACGGFFCNNTAPVEQTGEDIFFYIDGDNGTVTTHVQVQYQGPSEDFAWIVPVPAVPELEIGNAALFPLLSQTYAARYGLDVEVEGDCMPGGTTSSAVDLAFSSSTGTGTGTGGGAYYPGVNVVETGQVGPYDTVILQADSTSALLDWLNANGYDLPPALDPVLQPYVAGGQYFVALKLQKDKDVGDLAPLAMTYPGTMASVPIQLTSIAATPDMRLRVTVAGDHRAVPQSYLHLDTNPFAVDWWSGGSNYDEAVTLAALEAGGHGFATDYAGPPSDTRFASPGWDTAALAAAPDAVAFLQQLIEGGYPADDVLLDILLAYIPVPASLGNLDPIDLYNCPWCYEAELRAETYDLAGAAAAIEEQIVAPRQELDAMFDRARWVTRMTSSLSPEDMTVDPTFVLNPDLGRVDNDRRATLVYECMPKKTMDDVTRRLEVPGYPALYLPPESFLRGMGISDHDYIRRLHTPSNAMIASADEAGPTDIIVDNRQLITDKIAAFNGDTRADRAGCGCNTGGPATAAWALVPLLGGLRRRR